MHGGAPGLPPSYETVAGDELDDVVRETGGGAGDPYRDEKTPLPGDSGGAAAAQAGASTSSRSAASSRWSSAPSLVCSIQPSIPPGHAVLRARCFAAGAAHHVRVALATSTTLQVYDATRDSLLWELHGNSSQLVRGDEEPLLFGEGFRPSPDGSLLCVIASRGSQRRLVIVDAATGWVRSEHALSVTDGSKPHFSRDNSTVVLCHSGGGSGGHDGYFKLVSLLEPEGTAHRGGQDRVRRIRFEKPAPWQAMGIRFAPDSKHIIACAGPTRKTEGVAPSVSVSVYDTRESAGGPVRRTSIPCSPRFNSASRNVEFAADFHFPTAREWLVSFPDYSGPGKTCIVNARLGQVVAVFSSELTLSQRWHVGVSAPARAQVACDEETAIFTKIEVSGTMLARGQTMTITKFALSANGGREKAVLRRAYQIRAAVLTCRQGDVCALSPDGSHALVQKGPTGKIDVFSLAV